jgi:hypothetical protein
MTPEQLLEQLQRKITEANAAGNFDLLISLTKKAQRVRDVGGELQRLKTEIEALGRAATEVPVSSPVNGDKSDFLLWVPPLAIVFRPDGRPPVFVAARKGSDTMRRLLEVLVKELGPEILEKLTRLPANRGRIVSADPARDFVNRSRGTVYQHQNINGTRYSVLTNNSTEEKIGLVELIRQGLGLKPGQLQAYSEKRMPDEVKKAVGIGLS